MKDFFGNEVKLGDKVAYIMDRNSLEYGYIVSITDTNMGKVDSKPYNKDKNYNYRESFIRNVSNYQIIKVEQ
jgi:hypothetical protein